MTIKKQITELIYKNSKDINEGVLIDFKTITSLIEQIAALIIHGVSNSVVCCPQCGNDRLESTGSGWYICSDRNCDWGDKL